MRALAWLIAIFGSLSLPAAAASYTIEGAFEGCDYDKLYPLAGGGILECREYRYFYHYRPEVIADGRQVIAIANNRVAAVLHNGSLTETKVESEFNGCEFDKVYRLDNGLIFQCGSYSYRYAYRPTVRIFFVEGREPAVEIGGKVYKGKLFRSR